MPLSELPIELHEHVLDHLHDDPLSLRACSLTHTAWLPIARSHLFRTVRLDTARDCLRFLTTLDTTSESDGVGVGSLVRVLTLPAKMGFTELLHTRTVTRTRQARLRLDLLCQILRRVPNLETLDMTDFEWNCFADLICPQGAGVDLHDAVTVFAFPLLKVLVLRCFAVRSIQEIIQFIAAFPSVTTLELSGVWLYFHGFHYEPSDSIAYDQTISIRIRELIVGPLECTEPLLIGVSHALLNLTQGSQLRQLRWLFSPRVHDQEVFDKMFHGSASTLEVLEVDSLLVEWLSAQDLSRCRALTTIVLSEQTVHTPALWASALEVISSLAQKRLRHVEFTRHPRRDALSSRDLRSLSHRLMDLHTRCPTVSVTLCHCQCTAAGPNSRQALEANHKDVLRDVLEAGMRIAVAYTELDNGGPSTHRRDLHDPLRVVRTEYFKLSA